MIVNPHCFKLGKSLHYYYDEYIWTRQRLLVGLSARGSRAGNAEGGLRVWSSLEIPRVNQKATLDLDFAPNLIEYHYPSLASNILGGVCAVRTLGNLEATRD